MQKLLSQRRRNKLWRQRKQVLLYLYFCQSPCRIPWEFLASWTNCRMLSISLRLLFNRSDYPIAFKQQDVGRMNRYLKANPSEKTPMIDRVAKGCYIDARRIRLPLRCPFTLCLSAFCKLSRTNFPSLAHFCKAVLVASYPTCIISSNFINHSN